jgi:hypothetical protein
VLKASDVCDATRSSRARETCLATCDRITQRVLEWKNESGFGSKPASRPHAQATRYRSFVEAAREDTCD